MPASLALALLVLVFPAGRAAAQPGIDYRARTIYFIVADRFHPHDASARYVDPDHPDATNSPNCVWFSPRSVWI